ncbi:MULTISPECIES: hypothetical protein [Flavobacteriaceae]|uniref:Uncharacterized protein n=2 Tax=Flavobacteriaceae TaxID=49546 RepID=A0A4Y8AUJ9_9FLAO|nr:MULTISPECIES: hypothetical protein [Flavobacteriaceae]TEW75062.1 hypothetical protein E2488_05935 [Gramella jeungdoensis]GGK41939.1 hypothetical protein GCM10007963_07410 [Lutibacter litoralis]
MKTNLYLKTVLTVIAVCLTILTIKSLDLIPKAYAKTPNNLINKEYALVPINSDGSINVKITNTSEIDVNITSIDTSDELDVNIDEIGGGYVSHGGPIIVKMN